MARRKNPLRRAMDAIGDLSPGRRRVKRRLKMYAGYSGKVARARKGTHRRRRR